MTDILGTRILVILINILADTLVSHGVIDNGSKNEFVTLSNGVIAAVVGGGTGVYSIYKLIELSKHKITVTAQTQQPTTIPLAGATSAIADILATTETQPIENHTGLPTDVQTVPNPVVVAQ